MYDNAVHSRYRSGFCFMVLQYMHIPDRERCNWLRERIETPEEVGLLQNLRMLSLLSFLCR